MKHTSAWVVVAALALGGCSGASSLLNSKDAVPSAANVPVGNSLAMPPDLQLAPPTATSDAYQPNGPVASAAPAPAAPMAATRKLAATNTQASLYGGAAGAAPAPAPAANDIFAQYGISKINPDGTPKPQLQLNEELMAAIKKKKQQTNPTYGTIGNFGAIFKD